MTTITLISKQILFWCNTFEKLRKCGNNKDRKQTLFSITKRSNENIKNQLKSSNFTAVIFLFVEEFGCQSQFLLKIEMNTDVDVLEMLIVETFTYILLCRPCIWGFLLNSHSVPRSSSSKIQTELLFPEKAYWGKICLIAVKRAFCGDVSGIK